jgi:hypothetical protein
VPEVKRYDRRALVLDPPASALECGLGVTGIEPLYAKDANDAVLLAGEHGDQIAALVIPGTLSLDELDLMLERLMPRLEIGRGAVLVVAPPRLRAHLAGLRERGVCWAVWEPFDADELHFAVTATLSSDDALEPRRGLRVPIRLPIQVRFEGQEREGEVVNLAMGGAYVSLPDPPEQDASVVVQFPIGERMLETQARVAHRRSEGGSGPGMGLAFGGLAASDERLLDGFVRERVNSFRL